MSNAAGAGVAYLLHVNDCSGSRRSLTILVIDEAYGLYSVRRRLAVGRMLNDDIAAEEIAVTEDKLAWYVSH